MNARIVLSNEVIERGERVAEEMKLPIDTLLSYLLEGWTNPDFFLRTRIVRGHRRVAKSLFARKVELTRGKEVAE